MEKFLEELLPLMKAWSSRRAGGTPPILDKMTDEQLLAFTATFPHEEVSKEVKRLGVSQFRRWHCMANYYGVGRVPTSWIRAVNAYDMATAAEIGQRWIASESLDSLSAEERATRLVSAAYPMIISCTGSDSSFRAGLDMGVEACSLIEGPPGTPRRARDKESCVLGVWIDFICSFMVHAQVADTILQYFTSLDYAWSERDNFLRQIQENDPMFSRLPATHSRGYYMVNHVKLRAACYGNVFSALTSCGKIIDAARLLPALRQAVQTANNDAVTADLCLKIAEFGLASGPSQYSHALEEIDRGIAMMGSNCPSLFFRTKSFLLMKVGRRDDSVLKAIDACFADMRFRNQTSLSLVQRYWTEFADAFRPEDLRERASSYPNLLWAFQKSGGPLEKKEKRFASAARPVSVQTCLFCNTQAAKLLCCSICKTAAYCGIACQRSDWKSHKVVCKKQP